MSGAQPNHLAQQTSLYLQQHAHHPVDWYPWGEEALNKARRENKPILLSIGYSACHWCHVMAHESFADAATAEIMNAHFVNIKVDREERPDLDKIYQAAHHLLSNSSGGWPLTLFLSPQDQLPFFSGTYFPKTPRYGMSSFTDILQRVEHFYHSEQSRELTAQNQRLAQALQQIYHYTSQAPIPPEAALIEQAVGELSQQFDAEWGGFGQPPKFPHPTTLDFLLHLSQQPEALKMTLQTLQQMASSGIHDQLLGGFYRYSTDERWMIPHFEKMLYDNGLLLSSYTQAFRITGQPLFAQTANVIANWAIRTMQSPQGAFYASLDADSEGQEGKFYVWDRSEVQRLLAPVDFEIFALRYGLNRKPNFEGYWHLHGLTSFEEIAQLLQISHETITQSLHNSIQVLYKAREQRVHPVRDEKILTSWNALMIRGLAQAAFTLNQLTYADAATEALSFIHQHLWQNGRLLATYKDGHARVMAYVDDYAYLIAAILDLLQVRWNSQHLAFAVQLADVLLEQFEDKQQGGFWFTAHDHETLIQRPKITTDDALPAGNSIAAQSLLRLGALTGNMQYIEAAQRALQAGFAIAAHGASQHATLLKTSLENLNPSDVLLVRYPAGRMSNAWYGALQQLSNPYTQVYAIPNEETDLPPALAEKRPLAETTLYQCRGMMCAPPITDLAQSQV